MRKDVSGRRLFSREFKIKAVKRVLGGEPVGRVARDLEVRPELLWRWRKRVVEQGEEHLYDVGRRAGSSDPPRRGENQQKRIQELERLVGRQEMEIRFLDKALRRVEELRQEKNDDGEAASSKS